VERLRYASAVASIPIILDCDPGHDDALAIVLALARPELSLRAITTVAGNAPLDRTTRNALRVLTLLGRTDVPVAAGADRPLVREPWVPIEFHGDSGLDGADLPEPAVGPADISAVELMAALLREADEPVTVVATGPLTNVALLLRAVPALHERIAEISLMGGSLGAGNTTASAEFNIWADPEAAAIVFESGIPLRMSGLDVTHQALVLPADVARLEGLGTRPGRVFADLMRFFAIHHRDRYGWDGPPIHDAVAVAWLAAPDLVVARPLRVDVETAGIHTRGRTVADEEGLSGRPVNAEVGLSIDRARLIDMVVDAVGQFP
jgi:pyrimidine-specific ribonucleoside hydrolase